MMTCKDCIHYDVCSEKDGTTNFYGKEFACNDVEKRCQYFNDKLRIVELPCKVGETVHYITFWKNEYNYHLITNVTYDILYQLFHEMETGYVIYMTDDKSKAEAKLKELNNGL